MLLLWAGTALALGLLLYLADRQAGGAMLLPRFLALHTGPLFGTFGPWLPSFIHPFAFSLLSSAALKHPWASARAGYGLCAGWWLLNLVFELGQHARFSAPLAEALQSGWGQNMLTTALSAYALQGHFDGADVVALSAGSLAAAALLWRVQVCEAAHES